MIEIFLKPGISPGGGVIGRRPGVLAIFSFRYDSHLVPDLIANIEPLVDGWISYDDRSSAELFSNEPARRRALVEKALQLHARWILPVDPDERFERALVDRMPELTSASEPRAYAFDLREMFAPDRYRTDGIWGTKKQTRLLSLHERMNLDLSSLHSRWHDLYGGYRIVNTGLNLYHLKMITRARREARRDLYKELDSSASYQGIGYDYLADDDGAMLERIPPGRDYHPPHHDDGGLWMPKVG